MFMKPGLLRSFFLNWEKNDDFYELKNVKHLLRYRISLLKLLHFKIFYFNLVLLKTLHFQIGKQNRLIWVKIINKKIEL